ncbi:MAG: hypothetical protein ACK5XN_33280 [Bacteroidota bacterium]
MFINKGNLILIILFAFSIPVLFFFNLLFKNFINRFLDWVYFKIFSQNPSIKSIVFFFFCILWGCVLSLSLSYGAFEYRDILTLYFSFIILNVLFSYTVLISQLVMSILVIKKTGSISTIFAFISIIELSLIHFANRKRKEDEWMRHIIFVSNLIITFILVLMLSQKAHKGYNSTLSNTNIPVVMKETDYFFSYLKKIFSVKFRTIGIEKFNEFFYCIGNMYFIFFIKVWYLYWDVIRSWSWNNFDPYKKPINNFYYIGLSFCLMLFSYFLYKQYFLFTALFFFLSLNFMSIFAHYGFFLTSKNSLFKVIIFLIPLFIFNFQIFFFFMFILGALNPIFKFV